jgi:agmatinase
MTSLFGLNHEIENSEIVIVPAQWDVTTSYKPGTVKGPEHIKEASVQLDLYHPHFPNMVHYGIAMEPCDEAEMKSNESARKYAEQLIKKYDDGEEFTEDDMLNLKHVNQLCEKHKNSIYEKVSRYIEQDYLVGLVGGEHSVSLGFLEALSEVLDQFGILQIDAHMDLRESYQGFAYSHASVIRNALKLSPVSRLVQVGIRDYCDEELEVEKSSKGRIKTFYDRDLKDALYEGKSWQSLCKKIVNALPDIVYISFDIDGLDPSCCPHTGTPVPGGLTFDQAMYLIHAVVKSGRRIIGFDLVEVAPGGDTEWNGNVGARVLYHLAGYMHASNEDQD